MQNALTCVKSKGHITYIKKVLCFGVSYTFVGVTAPTGFILGGDFNINMLDKSHPYTLNYVLTTLDLNQNINQPTRITSSSSKLLDLFITNNLSAISHSSVLNHPPITDHEAIHLCYKMTKPKALNQTKIIRDLRNFDLTNFLTDLESQDYGSVYQNCHPELMLNQLSSIIKSTIDKHAPLKTIKINHSPAAWLNKDIFYHFFYQFLSLCGHFVVWAFFAFSFRLLN